MKRKRLMGILCYGSGLLIALLIFWGFYGFIKDDNWIAVSAFATLILAIAAFWAIRQNYNFRRQEKKERLLNEIIEWAIEVNSEEHKLNPKMMRAKGHYARKICLSSWSDLQKAIGDVMGELDQDIEILEKDIRESARKVIEEAAKIKTKDIGKQEENMSKESEATGSNEPTTKDIEEHLKRQDRQTKWQWLFSLGVSAIVVGLTWFIATTPRTPGDLRTGLFVFAIGLVISFLSLYCRYREKS